MMRTKMGLMLASLPLIVTLGCGESRPDPRANPDFDEEAYNDVDALPGMGEDGNLDPPPGLGAFGGGVLSR